MIQKNLMIPNYWWSQLFDDPQQFDDQLEGMDFDNPKGDTSITDGLVQMERRLKYPQDTFKSWAKYTLINLRTWKWNIQGKHTGTREILLG